MFEFDGSGAALSASTSRGKQQREQKDVAALLERLAETEAALLEERVSKKELCDELLRVRSAAVEVGGQQDGGGGSSDGRDNTTSSWVAGARTEGVVAGTEGRGRSGGAGDRGGRDEEKPPWKNGLYKRQPYADNYVPDSFLEKLVTNGAR